MTTYEGAFRRLRKRVAAGPLPPPLRSLEGWPEAEQALGASFAPAELGRAGGFRAAFGIESIDVVVVEALLLGLRARRRAAVSRDPKIRRTQWAEGWWWEPIDDIGRAINLAVARGLDGPGLRDEYTVGGLARHVLRGLELMFADWDGEDVRALDVGAPPPRKATPSRARRRAERDASVSALEDLCAARPLAPLRKQGD